MTKSKTSNDRVRHLFYLLGGVWGAGLGFLVSAVLSLSFSFTLSAAVLAGLGTNILFNLWFSVVFFWLRDIPVNRSGASYSTFLFINALLILCGLMTVSIAHNTFGISTLGSCALVYLVTSVLSLLLGRIWVFVSPSKAYEAYEDLDDSFYTDSGNAESVGSFRAWYHRGRWNETLRHFQATFKPGMIAYDLGSGGSEWNTAGLPLIGVDVNENLLRQGRSLNRLSSYVVSPIYRTGIESASADIVVLTEVLEHMATPSDVLAEIRRILKPTGHLILSVPNDWILSPFFWLFNLQCFYRGFILNEDYYRERCGHVNHFTPWSLRQTLADAGFKVKSTNVFRGLIIFTVSELAENR